MKCFFLLLSHKAVSLFFFFFKGIFLSSSYLQNRIGKDSSKEKNYLVHYNGMCVSNGFEKKNHLSEQAPSCSGAMPLTMARTV